MRNRKNYIFIGICILIYLLYVWCVFKNGYIYGSMTDWIDQHYNFPEYFRNLFYQTGNLFPTFALNYGAGQNIFYLAYYGLYSPIVILSFFFPFIKMSDFLMFVSILEIIVDIILMYVWLRKKTSEKNSFLGTLLFLFASSLVFHSHRHLMFVNYMPFLLLSLIGVDKYFEEKKSCLLIVGLFLIIMSSFYFSIGSSICILIYAICKYLETNKFNIKDFIKTGVKFSFTMILPYILAAFFLIPTFFCLLSGRTSSTQIDALDLIIPSVNTNFLLYGRYGMGLTSIFILSLIIPWFTKDKKTKFISLIFILILFFKIIVYLLNGTIYIGEKALIPLIPIAIYLIIDSLAKLKKISKKYLKLISLIFLLMGLIFYCSYSFNSFIIVDFLSVLIGLIVIYLTNKKIVLILAIILSSFVNFFNGQTNEKYVTKTDYDLINAEYLEENLTYSYRTNDNLNGLHTIDKISDIKALSTTIYSSASNSIYLNYIYNLSGNEIKYRNRFMLNTTNNIYFNTLMGVKYIYSNSKILGYESVKENDNMKIYQNNDVYTLGYASNKIVSKSEYDNLKFPYNMEALTKYIVTENGNSNIETDIIPKDLDFTTDMKYSVHGGTYKFSYDENVKEKFTINNYKENKVLIISFDLVSEPTDLVITINGVKNRLTNSEWRYKNENTHFTYVIEETPELKVKFSAGNYEISNLNVYEADIQTIKSYDDNIDRLNITSYDGTQIEGEIEITNDNSYLMFTIPYDKNFELYIDGEKGSLEKLNDAFMGSEITKGTHKIILKYNPVINKIGIIISVIGVIATGVYVLIEKKHIK